VTYSSFISATCVLAVLVHVPSSLTAQQPPPQTINPNPAAQPPSPPSVAPGIKPPAPKPAPGSKGDQLIGEFKKRVDAYAELRTKADDSAPALKESKDAGKIKDAQQSLLERIAAARSNAKPGDIFTPEVAAYFRRLLHPESKEPGTKSLMKEDKIVGAVPFKINGPYPDEKPLATSPPNLLEALPQLPKDIDYRFVGKHLILRDSRANMIIDYMLNAIP
jgi:hypothetical protein